MDYSVIIFEGADPLDPVDDNVDVEVQFEDGRRVGATFFTFENVRTILESREETGENLSGRYFWASYPVLVKHLTREFIEACVADLIKASNFETAFEEFDPYTGEAPGLSD